MQDSTTKLQLRTFDGKQGFNYSRAVLLNGSPKERKESDILNNFEIK